MRPAENRARRPQSGRSDGPWYGLTTLGTHYGNYDTIKTHATYAQAARFRGRPLVGESGQVWVRTHCPIIYAVSRCLRCEAKKTGQVLVRTSGCEKASDFSHGNRAMSADLKLYHTISAILRPNSAL